MPQNWSDWQAQIGKPLPRVFVLGGAEHAYIEEALAQIQKQVLSGGLKDFNYDKLNGKEESIENILDKANTMPMMATERLVEVADADKVIGENIELLEAYVKSPSPSTVLVFVVNQIDMRLKAFSLLDKNAKVFVFEHPKEPEMPAVVRKRAKSHGLAINEDAIFLLVMAIGTDLLMLERAFEKLALACANREITAHDVETHVASTRIEDAFAFGRAVALGDKAKALQALMKLEQAREVPLKLVGLLAWQFRQVFKAKTLLEQNQPEPVIGKTLALFGDRLKPVLLAAKRSPIERHAQRLALLAELDYKLKSSRAPNWLLVEKAVFELLI